MKWIDNLIYTLLSACLWAAGEAEARSWKGCRLLGTRQGTPRLSHSRKRGG